MRVRYIYSACVVIETEDLTLCCDPWFTPGAYYGSWYQYPPLPKHPIDLIGKVDAIYVSHIHPDHYDIAFLKEYLGCYPDTKIIIGETNPPYLLQVMRVDGLDPVVLNRASFGDTDLHIFANKGYEFDNIDTALVVSRAELSVANLNDNPLDHKQVDDIVSVSLGSPNVCIVAILRSGRVPSNICARNERGT